MKIKVVHVGKSKEPGFEEKIQEYLKRTRPFSDIKIVEVKDCKISKAFEKQRAVLIEGTNILKAIHESALVIALDENGEEFTSGEFAGLIKKFKDTGEELIFVIGGPYGLAKSVKSRAKMTIALSKMTFTHEMARLFLLEQIYRSVCIIQGKEYHN